LTIIGLDKEAMTESLFQHLTQPLDLLELKELQLSTLPRGLFAGLAVHDLRLSGQFLQDLEGAFEGAALTELSGLRIENTPIRVSQVCTAFQTMPNLRSLRLRQTMLYDIPSCLSTLTNLVYIDLSRNGIQNLRLDPFANHIQLTTLDLSNNLISNLTLPTNPYTLPLLAVLSLRSNILPTFPPLLLEAVPRLKALDISSNIITRVPTPLPASLSSLLAADNQIAHLPQDYLTSSLEILDLSSNYLTKIRYIL
jgi:Leucine-rich repeat (LRR) protein